MLVNKRKDFGVHMKFPSWIKNSSKTGNVDVMMFYQICFNRLQKGNNNYYISTNFHISAIISVY